MEVKHSEPQQNSPLWRCRRPETGSCCWRCSRRSPGSCRGRRRRSSDGSGGRRSCSARLGRCSGQTLTVGPESPERSQRIHVASFHMFYGLKGYDSDGPSSGRTCNTTETALWHKDGLNRLGAREERRQLTGCRCCSGASSAVWGWCISCRWKQTERRVCPETRGQGKDFTETITVCDASERAGMSP